MMGENDGRCVGGTDEYRDTDVDDKFYDFDQDYR